jgi:inosine/xanthosine triphosphatase
MNKAKNEAVRNIFDKVYDKNEYLSVETNSLIRNQPLSSDEAIDGAINRARDALSKAPGFDFGVGLEGTVDSNKHGMFLLGWVAVVNKQGKYGIGSSGAVLLPDYMRKKIESGYELGPVVQDLMNDSNNEIRHSEGACGLLTNGMYSRVHEFEDALICALSKFLKPDFYEK